MFQGSGLHESGQGWEIRKEELIGKNYGDICGISGRNGLMRSSFEERLCSKKPFC